MSQQFSEARAGAAAGHEQIIFFWEEVAANDPKYRSPGILILISASIAPEFAVREHHSSGDRLNDDAVEPGSGASFLSIRTGRRKAENELIAVTFTDVDTPGGEPLHEYYIRPKRRTACSLPEHEGFYAELLIRLDGELYTLAKAG